MLYAACASEYMQTGATTCTNKSHAASVRCSHADYFAVPNVRSERSLHVSCIMLFPSPHILIALIFADSSGVGSRGKDTHFDGGWFFAAENLALYSNDQTCRNINRLLQLNLNRAMHILHLASLTFWHRRRRRRRRRCDSDSF